MNITPDTERVEMPGLTEKELHSCDQFMKLYYFGEAHRITRKTLMNPTSSRGHAATIVTVRLEPKDPSLSIKEGKLVLVDLAGIPVVSLVCVLFVIARTKLTIQGPWSPSPYGTSCSGRAKPERKYSTEV